MVFTTKEVFSWFMSVVSCLPAGISTLIFVPLTLFVIISIWRWIGEHI